MSEISNDLSGKIDPALIRVLSEVKTITAELNIGFFIIGATARDIVMRYWHGIKAARMTKDVDIAVCLADWHDYSNLTERLLANDAFRKGDEKHRFVFGETIIDLIPFGDISGPADEIRWPPDGDIIMRTIGFKDVYKGSLTLRLSSEPLLDIKLASIPGLAVLKLLAWRENPSRNKDTEDLLFIMHKYQYAGIEDRLYTKEITLLQEEEFDNLLAGIRLLGRDMADISNAETAKALSDLLDAETKEGAYKMVSQMSDDIGGFEANMDLLKKLKQGYEEGRGL